MDTEGARRLWCGDRINDEGRLVLPTRMIPALMRSQFMYRPDYTWNPVTEEVAVKQNEGEDSKLKPYIENGVILPRLATEGWDDTIHMKQVNGNGEKKTPAHFGFSWLLYTLSKKKKWVYFMGKQGRGKSHLACVLGVHWMARTRKQGMYVDWAAFLSRMRHSFDVAKRGPLPESLVNVNIEYLIDVPFLVVDDLSSTHEVMSGWAIGKLERLMEKRYGKPTIWISNLTLPDLSEQMMTEARDDRTREDIKRIMDRMGSGLGGGRSATLNFVSNVGSYRRLGENS